MQSTMVSTGEIVEVPQPQLHPMLKKWFMPSSF
jgi:hypothetical protein